LDEIESIVLCIEKRGGFAPTPPEDFGKSEKPKGVGY